LQRQEHLSDAQIEQCANLSPGACPEQIESHLSECEFCLERLLRWQRIQFKRFEMVGMRQELNPECPGDSKIQEVAAGVASPGSNARILKHAAQCDHCGPLLNQYFEIFSEKSSSEIDALIDQLPSSKKGWEKEKAHEIARQIRNQKPALHPWWLVLRPRILVGAASLAALTTAVFLCGPVVVDAWQIKKEQKLVAVAFAKHRVTEMRLTDALPGAYRPVRGTMGSNNQLDELSQPELNKAWSLLTDKLNSGGKVDPRWLQAQGRLLLLKDIGNVKVAEASFHEAQSKGLHDPSVEIDLAVSYFEEDIGKASPTLNSTPDPSRLIRSIDLLTKVVNYPKVTQEQKTVALFNLAIAYEKSAMWPEAKKSWDKYLEIDRTGPWSDEARLRREADDKRMQKSRGQISFDPAFYLAHQSDPAVQDNIEEYQERAALSWLRDAVRQPGGASSQATSALAIQLKTNHFDALLSDLFRRVRLDDMPALSALSAALLANRQDAVSDALKNARISSDLFAKSHNVAGELWARFAEVYAYQRGQSGTACLNAATKLDQRLEAAGYPWLRGHLALEKATCRNFVSNSKDKDAEIEADLKRSQLLATQFGFPILHLRILGISPGIKRQQSTTCDQTWSQELKGMEEYWNGVYPLERLYQFYSVLEQCAEQEHYWNAAKTLMDSMIIMRLSMDEQDRDLNVVVALHLHLASILTTLRDNAGAEKANQQAEAIFNQGEGQNQYKAIIRILVAACQLERGKAEAALATLSPARAVIEHTDNHLVVIDFRRVMGKILLHLGRLAEAEQEYQLGIERAEQSLSEMEQTRQRTQWAAKTEELYGGLVQIWLEQKRVVDAWKLWEWSKTRSINAQAHTAALPPTPASWRELQQQILDLQVPSEPGVHLVYAVFSDRLHVWAVGRGEIRSKWVEIRQEKLENLVDDFTRKCANKLTSLGELQQQGKTLFALLVEPFEDELSATQTVALEVDQQV